MELRGGERLDDLEYKGLKIIQHKDKYCFTTDSVLLANFAKLKKGEIAADLCSGSGVIAILMAAKTAAAHIHCVELQEPLAEMSCRSIALNGLSDRITVHNTSVQLAHKAINRVLDAAVCNPPFGGAGGITQNPEIALARHEVALTFAEVALAASQLIKFGGRFYLIHRPERLAEVVWQLKANALEPKVLRFVTARNGNRPLHFLLEAHKNGKPGMVVLPELKLYNEDGSYTDEARKIYCK